MANLTFTPTEIPDVLVVDARRFGDDRGFFAEVHSQRNWTAAGRPYQFVQDNLSKSKAGTLRGMHYQLNAAAMGKYVRAITGRIFDVAVDLREGSPTFGKSVGRELSEENGLAMWVPEGFAHGFLALDDDTYVMYKCTDHYAPDLERSVRWNDPALGIEWPAEPSLISGKDAEAPLLADAEYDFVYAPNP